MAARSVFVVFTNMTLVTLSRQGSTVAHGQWIMLPPEEIQPGAVAEWKTESDGFATGTEGTIDYQWKSNGEHNKFHWDNPFSGSNSYDGHSDSGIVTISGGDGDDATVNFTLTHKTQDNWRWCNKCQCLAFAGNPSPGPCIAGGNHDHHGSGNYRMIKGVGPTGGQNNWRWCNRCQCMSFAGNPTLGICHAGGNHAHQGSGDYTLQNDISILAGQGNWRWCNKCQCLFFAGNATLGRCPAGGQHDSQGSGNYTLMQ